MVTSGQIKKRQKIIKMFLFIFCFPIQTTQVKSTSDFKRNNFLLSKDEDKSK
jgi:hypothetical protein